MSDDILISGLKRKYAQLAGQLRQARKTAHDLKEDMATVKATLKLFSAEAALEGVKPLAPPVNGRWFRHGQCSRAVLDTLRQAHEPLTLRQIAERVVIATDIRATTPADMKSVCDAVKTALAQRRGMMTVTNDRPQRWALAASEDQD